MLNHLKNSAFFFVFVPLVTLAGIEPGANCIPALEKADVVEGRPKVVVEKPSIGQLEFQKDIDVFNHPERFLSGPETTSKEDRVISQKALEILSAKGNNTANATHIADHLNTVQAAEVKKALEEAGVSEAKLIRTILLHDLGKEWDAIPADTRAFLESAFPKPAPGEPDKNFLPRSILSHEFSSMAVIEKIAKEAGIPESKIPRLKALIAHHNAGYDPNLPGFHFWVQPFAWGSFAKGMQAKGVSVPETYAPVLSEKDGGSAETIVLTAIDRATSLTLASQEKFAPVWLNQGKWSNDGVSQEIQKNAENVTAEVQNVLSKLSAQKRVVLQPALNNHFDGELSRIKSVAEKLPKMASGEGIYNDRPATTGEELANSVLYRDGNQTWYRVTNKGEVFRAKAGDQWMLDGELSAKPGEPADAPGKFFRKILYKDLGYEPATLKSPEYLK